MKSIIYSRFQLHPFVYIGTDGGPKSYSTVNINTRVQRVCFGWKLSGTNVVNDKWAQAKHTQNEYDILEYEEYDLRCFTGNIGRIRTN